jgi:hypothetical protein
MDAASFPTARMSLGEKKAKWAGRQRHPARVPLMPVAKPKAPEAAGKDTLITEKREGGTARIKMAGRKRPDMRCPGNALFLPTLMFKLINSQAISFHFLPVREIKATRNAFIFILELCVTCYLHMTVLSLNCLRRLVKFSLPLTNRFSLYRTVGFFFL